MQTSEIQPLKFEKVGGTNLYECEHVTEKTYPIEGVLPIGSHTNIVLCRHCWDYMVSMSLEYTLRDMLHERLSDESRAVLERILGSKEQTNNQQVNQ